jgi:nucleotide-binding universal stress UspA family protein
VFNKIIVPLDGSALAATVVPHAACMALMMKAQVILIRVGVPPRGHSAARFRTIHADLRVSVPDSPRDVQKSQFPIYRDQEIASREAELLESLAPSEEYFRRAGVEVCSRVLFGRPTEQILRVAEEEQAGAIMLSTHGDRGIGPWPLGDTTKRIIRQARIPVITIHPAAPKRPEMDMLIG